MKPAEQPVDAHFLRLERLLGLEAEAEKQEARQAALLRSPGGAEASGNSITGLVIREQDAGLGGRILLTLGKLSRGVPLPWTRLGTGTPVVLSEENADGKAQSWRGIVSSLEGTSIQVALGQWPETESASFRLDKSADDTARQRQMQGLESARRASGSRLAVMRDVLLGITQPVFYPEPEIEPLDKNLNPPQVEAVRFALSAEHLAVVHGPPGTGKTTTVVELIRQIIRRGESVVAVAPSNMAVDNLLEMLLSRGEKAVRLGHPARVLPELRPHTLDQLVEKHPEVRTAHKLIREAYMLRGQAAKYTRARPERGARAAMRQEAREMIADARKIEDQIVRHLIDTAQIVCATTTGLDQALLGERTFDWCIMDEASQSTEPGAWIPLQYAQRLVLAGDPYQLPPTVISQSAASQGYNVSLLERVLNRYGPGIARLLTVQYRMHQEIMAFSSAEFYEGRLVPAPQVASHLLEDLPNVQPGDLTGSAVQFIDTAGASYDEALEPEGESRLNPLEAAVVVRKVQALLESGLPPGEIAVISPYSAQVRWLREQIRQPEMEIDSVDGFQGREKEAVIVSLVRSNRDGAIGFLADTRRMNVALTRARRKLIVIGDSATITADPFYQRMVEYFESIGAYRSVWEE